MMDSGGWSEEIVSKLDGTGFQPSLLFSAIQSWGFAPGWYGVAPLALNLFKQ
jgi:hypothetical protein